MTVKISWSLKVQLQLHPEVLQQNIPMQVSCLTEHSLISSAKTISHHTNERNHEKMLFLIAASELR